MSINRVCISGNLTRDPEARNTASGVYVLCFGVAVEERRRNAQTGEYDKHANYVDCAMFGDRAMGIRQYLRKGTAVVIDGRLRWSQWERDGQKRSKLEVIVDDIDFSNRDDKRRQPTPGEQYDQTAYIENIPF